MKFAIVFCVCFFITLAVARSDDKYTDRYDSINLDEVLANKRLLDPYIKCTLDKGRCAPDARELKGHISEALANNCAKCTPAQKKGTRQVIQHLINYEPGYWKELTVKYDPERKYTVRYEEDLRKVHA